MIIKWAVGITTVPRRRLDLFPQTIASLALAGFPRPRIFVDGWDGRGDLYEEFMPFVTSRFPLVQVSANWVLSLYELYVRNPKCDRYAMFQDDILAPLYLREYLDSQPYPTKKGYWNLYTAVWNLPQEKPTGWFEGFLLDGQSPRTGLQKGIGALGLVFDKEAVLDVLSNRHFITERFYDDGGWRSIDGGVVSALNAQGYREYVHSPSLLKHTGTKSTVVNKQWSNVDCIDTFPGETFDARTLIRRTP